MGNPNINFSNAAIEFSQTPIPLADFVVEAHSLQQRAGFSDRLCAILGYEFSSLRKAIKAADDIQYSDFFSGRHFALALRSAKINREAIHVVFIVIAGATKEILAENVARVREAAGVDYTKYTLGNMGQENNRRLPSTITRISPN